MAMFQFIDEATGLGVSGKKQRTKVRMRNASAAKYTGRPHLPRSNFEGKRGAPVHRRQMRQPIDTMYDVRKEFVESEVMELKAVDEPMLMSERAAVERNVTKIELNGRFHLGETLATHGPNGTAPSRANANSCLRQNGQQVAWDNANQEQQRKQKRNSPGGCCHHGKV